MKYETIQKYFMHLFNLDEKNFLYNSNFQQSYDFYAQENKNKSFIIDFEIEGCIMVHFQYLSYKRLKNRKETIEYLKSSNTMVKHFEHLEKISDSFNFDYFYSAKINDTGVIKTEKQQAFIDGLMNTLGNFTKDSQIYQLSTFKEPYPLFYSIHFEFFNFMKELQDLIKFEVNEKDSNFILEYFKVYNHNHHKIESFDNPELIFKSELINNLNFINRSLDDNSITLIKQSIKNLHNLEEL